MSETTAGDEVPTEGVNSTVPPASKTADNISGDVVTQNAPAPTNNATSPMDVDPKDDAIIGVTDPLEILPQNNSDVVVKGNNEAATGETHAPTINNQSLPPRERGDVVESTAAAAALAAQAADVMEDCSVSTPKDNIISNGTGTEAPAVQQPAAAVDNNTKEAAANSDRMNSPMNILAEVASVESTTGDEGDKQKNNDNGSDSNAIPADFMNHNDIILSLKDSTYKTIMHQYYRKLAAIEDLDGVNGRKEEKNIKEEVFTLLKNAGGRLLSYVDDRNPSMGFIQINDKTARAIIFNDIRMRNDSKDQWAVDAAKVDLHKLAEIAASGEEGEPQLPPSGSTESNQMELLPDPSARIYHPKPVYKPNPDAEEQSPSSNYSYLDTYQQEYLKTWMTLPAHIEDPYPTEAQKARILKDTGIGKSALYNWFVSNRTRKWKPALLAIRSKYNLDKSEQLAPFMKIELAEDIFPACESAEYLDGIFHKEGITTDLAMETQHKGARLPEPWEEYFDDKAGYFYYHNPMTGKTQWKHPAWGNDEHTNVPKHTPKPPAPAPAPAPPAEIDQSRSRQTSQESQKPPKQLFNVAELKRTAKFNVGGNLFEVLCSHLPNSQESRIAQMAQASIRGDVAIPLARDIELFSLCVRFMRKNKIDLPGNVPEKLFLEELDYFGIPHEKDHLNTIRNPSSTTNQVNVETTATATVTKQRRPGRRGKCGECAGCLRDNCGECAHCLDMPQFGGPGVKRQRCLERRCIKDDAQPPAGGRVKKQAKGPAKLISPDGRKGKEEASWENEFAKIQEELNRKAAEAGKGGTIFGLTTAVSKKPNRTSARNAEKKRQRQASETSDDDDDTYASDQLQSVFAKGYAEYSKKSTGRKRNATGHLKPATKATSDVQKRYEDMQRKKVDNKDQHSGLVRGVTVRPSGKWQVQYYYCGSSRYIGVFNNKEEALAAYETVREMLGKSERDTLTKEEVSNNINLARKAAFSGRGLTYTGPQADRDSLIRAPEKITEKMTARQKRIAEKKSEQLDSEDDSDDEENGYVDNEVDEYDGRYSIKRCSAMACDQVAVFGDRCIAHRPMCSKRGCQKLVHSDGKCKTHLKSSKRPTHASRAKSVPFGIGYKFRKQFDGDLFEGEVIEVLPGGGQDRRCKYLIDGFVEDLSVADLRILAQLEADNPVEFGKVGYRFRKQFNEGWFDGIVVKVLSRGANGKDRRVHYAADDDFEDLSLDDLRTIALSDEKACDECRSRMIFCDGTQTFCLNNESIDEEEVEQDVEEEAELNEVVKESRGSRRQSGRGEQKVEKSDDEESPEFFQPTDNDMILSLKDPKYKEIMHKAFRKLGAKAESNRDKDEERQVKMDVFDSLKESGFQLTKHVNFRKPDLGVMVVDDAYARDKINSDISRRLESKERWADESDDGNSDEIVAPVKSPAKYRPRVRAKTPQDAEPEESSGDESELETAAVNIVQDESKRRKLKQTCDIHGSTCTIWEALDIGPNWMCHVVPRKNGDHSPDKFFYDPKTGEKFRSFISVKRHVEQKARRKSSSTKKRKRAASPAESVDSNFHNDICECCGGLGELLCCSTCNLVYHLECTRPTLSELPEGDWSCAFCVAAGTGVDNSEPPLTKAEAIQGMKDIEALKRSSIRKSKRARIA